MVQLKLPKEDPGKSLQISEKTIDRCQRQDDTDVGIQYDTNVGSITKKLTLMLMKFKRGRKTKCDAEKKVKKMMARNNPCLVRDTNLHTNANQEKK